MQTITVSQLKEQAHNLPVDETLIITQNGKPVYAIEDYETYARKEAAALKQLIGMSKDDVDSGRVKPLDESMGELDTGKYSRVSEDDYSASLMSFRRRELDLYTKKNHKEFVKLEAVKDVKRYAHRLYIKNKVTT